jgi:hypothetical protein
MCLRPLRLPHRNLAPRSGRAQHRPEHLVLMGAPSGVIGVGHLCWFGWS